MERAAKGHKDISGSISRKRETELKDDISRMEIQAVTDLLEREAQSPSKDDYRPPGNRGFFIASGKLSLNAITPFDACPGFCSIRYVGSTRSALGPGHQPV